MHVEFEGGSAELRDKLSVSGASLVNAYAVPLQYIRERMRKSAPKVLALVTEVAEKGTDGLDTADATKRAEDAVAESDYEVTPEDMLAQDRWQQAQVVARLRSWCFDDHTEPLPTMDTIGELDIDVFQALAKAVNDLRDKDRRPDLSPDAGVKDKSRSGPTGPSAVSKPGVREPRLSSVPETKSP